ncbi:MAG TPA: hypothetical protein VMY77_03180 [Chitinophagaceae bacterium]|nr:hypothetical protein [Chitinophagaceae bacterium]
MPLTFTPIQNDLDEANAKLKALYDAYNALEAKVNGTPTASGFPAIINLPEQKAREEIRPVSYSQVFDTGRQQQAFIRDAYSTNNAGLNNVGNRPDLVYMFWGYNVAPNNNRLSDKDIGADASLELSYKINDGALKEVCEYHIFRITAMNGKQQRIISAYIDRLIGTGFINVTADYIALFKAQADGTQKQYASIGQGRVDVRALETGRGIGFFATDFEGKSIELSAAGGIGKLAFNGVSINGFGEMIVPLPSYGSDAEAASDIKIKPNQFYRVGNSVRIK